MDTVVVLGALPAPTAELQSGLSTALAQRLPGHRVVAADEASLPAHTRTQGGSVFFLLVAFEPGALQAPDAAGPAIEASQRDARLRAVLIAARQPFAVLHGRGADLLAHALRALGLGAAPPARARMAPPRECERCSDPACEHRLFTDLLRRRADSGGAP